MLLSHPFSHGITGTLAGKDISASYRMKPVSYSLTEDSSAGDNEYFLRRVTRLLVRLFRKKI